MRRRRRHLKRVKLADRIVLLLHANRAYLESYVVPPEMTQDGMSGYLGIRQNHISRALRPLEDEGLVESRTAHVQGKKRRLKVYSLTGRGEEHASNIISDLDSRIVEVINPGGGIENWSLSRAAGYLSRRTGKEISYLDMIEEFLDGKSLDLGKFGMDGSSISEVPVVEEFFGREDEMESLTEAIDSDGIRFMAVISMAGQGKTTLLSRLANKLKKRNVVWINANRYHTPTNLLMEISGYLPGFSKLRDRMMTEERTQLLESLRRLISELDRNGAVLILDDVQRFDPEVKGLLESLRGMITRGKGSGKILISGREREGIYNSATVETDPGLFELELGGLDRISSTELLDSMGVDPKRRERIYEISRGHPLSMKLFSSGEVVEWSDYRKSLERFIEEEILARMKPDEKMILDYLSVFRFPVDRNALKIASVPSDALRRLSSRALLREYPRGKFDLHDLIRDRVIGFLNDEEVKRYSLMAAKYYSSGIKDLEISEYIHFLHQGGDRKKTMEVLSEWGEYLVSRGYSEVHLIAVRSLENAREPRDRKMLELILYENDLVNERLSDARSHLDRAADICRKEMKRSEKGVWKREYSSVLDRYAELSSLEGLDENVIKNYRKSLSIMERSGDTLGVARVLNNMGVTYMERGDLKNARSCFERAEKKLKECGSDGALPLLHLNMADLFLREDRRSKCAAKLKRSVEEASRDNMVRAEITARSRLGDLYLENGDKRRARTELLKATALLIDNGDVFGATECFTRALPVLIDLGEVDRSRKMAMIILREQGLAEKIGVYTGRDLFEKRQRSFLFLRLVVELLTRRDSLPKEELSKYLGWCSNRLPPEKFLRCVKSAEKRLCWVKDESFWDLFHSMALDSSGVYEDLHPRALILISWACRKKPGSKGRKTLARRAMRLCGEIGFGSGEKRCGELLGGKP